MVQKVPQSGISGNSSFKNLIINGEMQIRQRADTSVHNNGQVRPCDMWKQEASNCDNLTGTLAIDSSVHAGYGFSGSLRFDTTTAESALASDENVKLITDVEAQNAHHLCYGHSDAKKTVLSWWSKSNLSGSSNKFVINVSAPDGSRHISKTFFHASADTWENFTFVIDGDSSGTINDDNGAGLTLTWVLAAGSDYTSADSTSWGSTSNAGLAYQQTANIASSTSNDFYITGVQLEVGDTASNFEHLPFDVQLQRCQRYFQLHTNPQTANNEPMCMGQYYSSSQVNAHIHMPVQMRSSPTLECTDVSNHFAVFRNGTHDALNNWTRGESTERITEIYNNSDVSGTAGHGCTVTTNSVDARMSFNAEL